MAPQTREVLLPKQCQAIAKFGSTYGVKGQLKVYPFTTAPSGLLNFSRWFDGNAKALLFEHLKQIRDYFVVSLVGITTPEQAQSFVNQLIYVPEEDFPVLKAGEYYWFNLLGCNVVNVKKQELGQVTSILPTGSNDVLVVENQTGKRILIPFLTVANKVIIKVDLPLKLIIVDWEIDY